jgi:flavorubredoxin
MLTRVAEVADGIYQLTTHIDDINFSFNQYLVTGEEPLLFHTGGRQLFPLVSEAIEKVTPVESLRWISFGHVESDESGSMNEFLARAPQSTVTQSVIGCMVSIGDLADRAPKPLADGEVLDIGGHRMRWIDTPHLPHGWEAGIMYDETTKTLLAGDLFTQNGAFDPTSDADIVGPAIEAEDIYGAFSLHPSSGARLRELAELDIERLALMHGPVFGGDAKQALVDLAGEVDRRIAAVA